MDKNGLLSELLELAIDNTLEDVAQGKYADWVDVNGKKSAALALIAEEEFMTLVEMSGQFKMDADEPDFWVVKQFFEENIEDGLLGS